MKAGSLRTRLLAAGVSLTGVPLVVFGLLAGWQGLRTETRVADSATREAAVHQDQVIHLVSALCETYVQGIRARLELAMSFARTTMEQQGGIRLANGQQIHWQAKNQFTGTESAHTLPAVYAGGAWLGQIRDPRARAPLVDEVANRVRATCTVFERMNAAGDMLRVATTVIGKDGSRAIGTYIPAVQPNGGPNAVVSTVLKGYTYVGRAFVVDGWYSTAYSPLYGSGRQIIGMLYVGISERDVVAGLRTAIDKIAIGKTGSVFILNASGSSPGQYVLSRRGERDGENVWQAKDSHGGLFVQEICRKALQLPPGEAGEQRYRGRDKGEAEARAKSVRFTYFRPFDWVIAAGANEDEILATANAVESMSSASRLMLGLVCLGALILSGLIWLRISGGLTERLAAIVTRLGSASREVAEAARQTASSSQALAQSASEQAASLEETSASCEEISATARRSSDHTRTAAEVMAQSQKLFGTANQALDQMVTAIGEIDASSGRISKIIKVVDEITFQTNILALNAAVEAARAGEAGLGFAVVADEVRRLAQRCAAAAGDIAGLIEDSLAKSRDGKAKVGTVNQAVSGILGDIAKVKTLVDQVNVGGQEEVRGFEQINKAIGTMEQVTQKVAATAEESAAAGQQLEAQSAAVHDIVRELAGMVGGREEAA